jgi:hypothetical protein
MSDFFTYDKIPKALRVQIVHIIRDALGEGDYAYYTYKEINETLCREFGLFELMPFQSYQESIFNYLLQCQECEKIIDIIELCFITINTIGYEYVQFTQSIKATPEEAIQELNDRFKEHGIGYQFESNEIIKVDSQYLHSEIVKPALQILGKEERFKGANEEFLEAHEHYSHNRYKECLVAALKAFESVMKAICSKQGWQYNQNDSAKKLIEICFEKDLIPDYLQSHFAGLRAMLEGGVPTVRNKLGGHGQGTENIDVPESIASFALHITAANILLLVRSESENYK